MSWYNKYFHCADCQTDWQDEWNCLCNDRCPTCDAETEPYDYAEIDINSQDKAYQDMIMYGKGVTLTNGNLQVTSVPFILIISKGDLDNENLTLSNFRGVTDLSVLLSGSESSNDSGTPDD